LKDSDKDELTVEELNEKEEERAAKEKALAEKMRFLKKVMIFSFGYIVVFSITMIIIYCIRGDYPETLTTVTFVYFSAEAIISAAIKIFEKKSK